METPLISVVIPAYNCSRFLPETLESVFAQSWPAVEIIVIDDGSTDHTPAVISSYSHRLRSTRIENSGGPSTPRNIGTRMATGEFVAFCDSDDVMQPDKIAAQMDVFASHPEVDLVCTTFRGMDEEGAVVAEDWLADYRGFRKDASPANHPDTIILDGETAFRQLLRANFVGCSSVVCRTGALLETDLFDEDLNNSDDFDMWLQLARGHRTFAFIDRPLHSYRVVESGVTKRGWKRIPAMIRVLERQIPHCTDQTDRKYIAGKIRSHYMSMGWANRKAGDLKEAQQHYRTALTYGWSPMAAVSLARVNLLRWWQGFSGSAA